DLLDAPEQEWRAEQHHTVEAGWGAQLLALQDADGSWGGGIYTPKWTSTTYTMLTLCDIGIPGDHRPAQKAAELTISKLLGGKCDDQFRSKLADCDRCIVGMILLIATYFGIRDARIDAIVENLLSEMMPDGAWNCCRLRKPKPHHS